MKNSRTLYRYCGNYIKYMQWESDYHLPPYNFCPWGWRSQCYILGIMTGYLLWVTKDKKVVIDKKLNLLIWFNAIVLGLLLVYRNFRGFHDQSDKVVDKLGKVYSILLCYLMLLNGLFLQHRL